MNLHIAIGLLLAVIGQTSGLEKIADNCDPSICRLPTCYCGGTAVRNKCGLLNLSAMFLDCAQLQAEVKSTIYFF